MPSVTEQDNFPWISRMEEFSRFVQKTLQHLPPNVERRAIKVAVIDDGVDMLNLDNEFPGQLKIVTFEYEYGRDVVSSACGHGTTMVEAVQAICPQVHLKVGKLQTLYNRGEHSVTLCLHTASRAINWAIEEKVDIISMSWSFERSFEGVSEILLPAIRRAHENNIIMFASDNDMFLHTREPFSPGEEKGVFCIGAAIEKTGLHPSKYSTHRVDLLFPSGLNRRFVRIKDKLTGDASIGGSSYATALAAGFTALIFQCIVIAFPPQEAEKIMNCIRTHENMTKIFKHILEPQTHGIAVTEFFRLSESDWRGTEDAQQKLAECMKRVIGAAYRFQ